MTNLTTPYSLPTPEGTTSPPNVPVHMKALADKVASELAAGAGFRSRGKAKVTAEQTRTTTTYGTLGTPDEVSGIVLPADGLLRINYRALAKATNASCKAALFLNGVQIYGPVSGSGPADYETSLGATAYRWLMSDGLNGLRFNFTTGLTDDSDDYGFPMIVGPDIVIDAPADTYTVSIRFKAASGQTISVKRRWLRVTAQAYD